MVTAPTAAATFDEKLKYEQYKLAKTDLSLKKKDHELKSNEYQLKRDEYNLKLSDQANALLALGQNVILFLTTGAVATVGFAVSYSLTNAAMVLTVQYQLVLLAVGGLSGIMAALCGLQSMLYTLKSYSINIGWLYEGKVYDELTADEQQPWDTVTTRAKSFRTALIWLLCVSILCQALHFGSVLVRMW